MAGYTRAPTTKKTIGYGTRGIRPSKPAPTYFAPRNPVGPNVPKPKPELPGWDRPAFGGRPGANPTFGDVFRSRQRQAATEIRNTIGNYGTSPRGGATSASDIWAAMRRYPQTPQPARPPVGIGPTRPPRPYAPTKPYMTPDRIARVQDAAKRRGDTRLVRRARLLQALRRRR